MLSLTEMPGIDSALAAAALAPLNGALRRPADGLPTAGFADLLLAAAPVSRTPAGEALPAGGENLPAAAPFVAGLPAEVTTNAQALVGFEELHLGGEVGTEPVSMPATIGVPELNDATTPQALPAHSSPTVAPVTQRVDGGDRAPGVLPRQAPAATIVVATPPVAASAMPTRPAPAIVAAATQANHTAVAAAGASPPKQSDSQLADDLTDSVAGNATGAVDSAMRAPRGTYAVTTPEPLTPAVEPGRPSADAPAVFAEARPVSGLPSAAMPPAPPQATGTAPAAIDVPLADPRWGDAVGERVLWMAGQKLQSAEIRMNPAELGPVKVEVRIDESGVQVTFTAQHALTREALEQALPRLRELFSSEGLTLAGADVADEGVRHERGDGSGRDARGARLPGETTAADDADAATPRPAGVRERGLVDTYA